jgi:hypothetical protein
MAMATAWSMSMCGFDGCIAGLDVTLLVILFVVIVVITIIISIVVNIFDLLVDVDVVVVVAVTSMTVAFGCILVAMIERVLGCKVVAFAGSLIVIEACRDDWSTMSQSSAKRG